MATTQSGKNVVVAYKAQSALGTAASGASGLGLQIAPSPGFALSKAIMNDPTIRRDGQSRRGRHGSRKTAGQYNVPLRVGELDTLLAALLRTTATASADITEATASLTSITTTTSTIVAGAGSWITGGVRKGDVVKLTGHSTAANNGIWLRVLSVTASTITVPANSLTLNATPDTAFTLTIAKTIASASTLTETYFTFDEYHADIDTSDKWTDCKVSRFKLSAKPNEIVMCEFGLVGLDGDPLATGASPSLTSPTFTTTLGLELSSGKVCIGGVDYADITGIEFEYDLGGMVPDVLAPNGPDVFLGNAACRGQVTCLRPDSTHFTAFDNETALTFQLFCEEPETAPKDFVSFYIGNAAWAGHSSPLGEDGPLVQTLPFIAGIDEDGGTSVDATTTFKMMTSAT